VDNFGVTGEKPSHPELLDHLASKLINSGWSLKKLTTYIVQSRAYRMSSAVRPEGVTHDPDNPLVLATKPQTHGCRPAARHHARHRWHAGHHLHRPQHQQR